MTDPQIQINVGWDYLCVTWGMFKRAPVANDKFPKHITKFQE